MLISPAGRTPGAPFIPVPPPRGRRRSYFAGAGAGVAAAVFGMSCGNHLTT